MATATELHATTNEIVDRITAVALHYLKHDQAEDFLMEIDMQYPGLLEDCGSCGSMHPRWWSGDCRNDHFRF